MEESKLDDGVEEKKKQMWDADFIITDADVKKFIYEQFPELSGLSIEKVGQGWDNTVYLVGEEFVFRFPRREIAIPGLKTEAGVLPNIEDYVTLPYSKPIFFGKGDGDYTAPFLGYPFLKGGYPLGLSDEQRAKSTLILAKFLKKLHSFPVEEALKLDVRYDTRNLLKIKPRKEAMCEFFADLQPYFEKAEQDVIESYIDGLKTDEVSRKDAFLHGDLHFKNILVDESGQLSGIIDWGDINIGHPGCDLSLAFSFLPPSEREKFFNEYGKVDEETMILARFISVFIPMLVMMQAIDENEMKIAEEAKASILRALAE